MFRAVGLGGKVGTAQGKGGGHYTGIRVSFWGGDNVLPSFQILVKS